ncbi:uncharacterized protein [Temnothorax longispinosus]|uniref:uncharacterized protein isoform X2 n=1 Tax=Temnothorax longispinosus TaxID=300112 RepID=UPI003A9A4A05
MSSSSGLDMPNVDEAKKVVRNRTLPRQRSFQTQEINDGLTTRLSEIEVTSIFRNPNIYLPRNNDKNVPSDEVDTIQRVVDTIIDHSASGNSNYLRKLSLPDEAGPSQRLFEKADVTYKSVHFRYPQPSRQPS